MLCDDLATRGKGVSSIVNDLDDEGGGCQFITEYAEEGHTLQC